jgi:hypothetical protein
MRFHRAGAEISAKIFWIRVTQTLSFKNIAYHNEILESLSFKKLPKMTHQDYM